MAAIFNIEILPYSLTRHLLDRGDYVDGTTLAKELEENRDEVIPPDILDYLCCFLRGEVGPPRGRPPQDRHIKWLRESVIRYHYRRIVPYLTYRKRRYGKPAGWLKRRGTPAELAARLVAKRWHYGEESWRTVQNIASSQK